MNLINSIFSEKLVDSFGWALFHSLWQGIIITIIFAALMIFMRRYSSRTRYLLGIMSLVILFSMSSLTFMTYYSGNENFSGNDKNLIANQSISKENKNISSNNKNNLIDKDPHIFSGIKDFFSSYYQRNLPLIVSLWFSGILFLSLKFTGSFLYTQRFRNKMVSKPSGFWVTKLLELKKKINYKKEIVFLSSALIKTPMVIGFFKPVMLFPASLFSGMPVNQVEAILAHELAHIYRRDYIVNILQAMVDIVYFYHPGIRWISSMVRFERENSCDDIAIEISGDSKGFAEALTKVQSFAFSSPKEVMAITGHKNRMLNRIKRIVNRPKGISGFSEGFFAASILAVSISLLVFSTISADVSKREYIRHEYKQAIGDITYKDNIIHLKKNLSLQLDGVLTNNNQYYKKFKLKSVKTGKVVWQLKKKNLSNWGPIFRFSNIIKLRKGDYKIDVYEKNNSYALIYKEKNNKNFHISSFKAGTESLPDKMIGLFIEEVSNKELVDKMLKKNRKEFKEKELAIKKAEKAYQELSLQKEKLEYKKQLSLEKELKEKKRAEKKAAEEFEKIIKKEKKLQFESEKAAKEKYKYEVKRRELALKKAEQSKLMREKEVRIRERVENERNIMSQKQKRKQIELEKLEKELVAKQIKIEQKEQENKIIRQTMITELINDKLIKKGENYTVELSSKIGLLLNEKKMGRKFYLKYKKLYEKTSGKKLSKSQRFILNGEYNKGD